MLSQESSASYAMIRHNIRTYISAGVVAIIQGKRNAESELKKLEDAQRPADRHEGWRYFLEKTDLKPGTDPLQATRQRQAQLERRESNALRLAKIPVPRSPNPPRNFR